MKPIKHLRWWIVWTLFGSTVINYISRQTLAQLSPVIIKEFHLSHADFGAIAWWFQAAYASMWLVGGVILDQVGARLGLALAVAWWSVVSAATSFANSLLSFKVLRFLLGVGEGCNWPGASKVVAEWFPARERGLAIAIFDSGSSVGGIIAGPVVALVAVHLGWRYAFIVSGLLGGIWLIPWLRLYHPIRNHPRVEEEERALIEAGRDTAAVSTTKGIRRYLGLLKQSNVWGIVLGRTLTDPIWWFYITWLPQYFSEVRGFNLTQIGFFMPVVYLAADAGNFTGGFASGYLIKRGVSVVRARKWICILSSVPILAGIPAALTNHPYWALALVSLATWGYASWSTMGLAFPSDLFPQDVVASVTGLSGLVAGFAGGGFQFVVGLLVDRFHSYLPAFFAAGLIPLLATASVLFLIRPPARA